MYRITSILALPQIPYGQARELYLRGKHHSSSTCGHRFCLDPRLEESKVETLSYTVTPLCNAWTQLLTQRQRHVIVLWSFGLNPVSKLEHQTLHIDSIDTLPLSFFQFYPYVLLVSSLLSSLCSSLSSLSIVSLLYTVFSPCVLHIVLPLSAAKG